LQGIITTKKDLLHTNSEQGNADTHSGISHPAPGWPSYLGQDPKSTKSRNTLGFFCNLTSILARKPDSDPNDSTEVKIQILVFLQSKKMATTALPELLPLSHEKRGMIQT
jgi:hypothetical protein